ncbi:MAG: LamG domain-containing protein, partial [Mariprofundaceae bacterium]|nr:LamG domain-containing protein [Mariprofundaceae bacterium]
MNIFKRVKLFGILAAACMLPFAMSGTANAGLNDGLAGYWTFDEGVGIVANDVSGNGNTGTILNGATYGPGYLNTGLYFDGINDNVEIPDAVSLNPSAITISAFVQVDALTGDIVSQDGEAFDRQYRINIFGGHFRAHVGTTTGFWVFDGATSIIVGSQHHVAMTYDGSTLKLFVDGVLDGSMPVTGNLISTPQPVRIGGGAPIGQSQLYYTGGIDEVKLYKRALAACEVERLAGGTGPCLLPAIQSAASPSRQHSQIDTELTQDIVTPTIDTGWGPGYAWLPDGRMLLHGGSQIHEYTVAQSATVHGTPVYTKSVIHTVPGLPGGYGMTNGTDGFLYVQASNGLYRVDPATWTAVQVSTTGGYYGIGTLPDGRIIQNANSRIYAYNPATSSN